MNDIECVFSTYALVESYRGIDIFVLELKPQAICYELTDENLVSVLFSLCLALGLLNKFVSAAKALVWVCCLYILSSTLLET